MKNCPSYPGYAASDAGHIFSHRRKGTRPQDGSHGGTVEQIDLEYSNALEGWHDPIKGYIIIGIRYEGKKRTIGAHQLVADAFHGPCPKGLQVRHLDGNTKNNKPDNLKYGTPLENNGDRILHGTYTSGQDHHNAKLSAEQVAEVRALRKQKVKVKILAAQFNVSIATIESIIYNKSYK